MMRRELANPKNSDDNPVAFLKSVWKTSKNLCLQIYQKPKAKDTEYFAIMARNATIMGEGQIKLLDLLMTWRDFVARIEDESIKFVMPNDVLFDIAKSSPRDLTELEQVLRRHPKHTHHELIYKYEEDLLKRINEIVKDCEEKIKTRVEENRKRVHAYNAFSDSSSSSDEEESKVAKKAKVTQPQTNNTFKINTEKSKV
jgi:ribonuclease D